MKYLKQFENFETQGQEDSKESKEIPKEDVKSILDEISDKVGVEISQDSLKDALDGKNENTTNENMVNESFLMELWSEMTTLVYNPGTLEWDTISGTGLAGWVGTILSSVGVIGSLRYVGKKIVGMFKGKEIDIQELWTEFCKEKGIDSSIELTINPDTEEGKELLVSFAEWSKNL